MLQPVSGRNSNGTFAPGHAPSNPTKPYRRYGETVRMLQGKYSTREIIALSKDADALGDMTPLETMAIRQMARALTDMAPETCADIRQEREVMLDRMEGKVPSPIANDPENPLLIAVNIAVGQLSELPPAYLEVIERALLGGGEVVESGEIA